MKTKPPRKPRLVPLSFMERESSFLGKQQLYVLVYCTAAVIIGICANLTGLTGPQRSFNLWLNAGYFLAAAVLFAGYMFRKIPIASSLFGIIMLTQVSTSAEMLYCASVPDTYHMMLIVGNMVLLAVNILFSLVAYLEYTPYILSVLGIGTYIACMEITGDSTLGNFFGVYLVIFAVVCILGSRLVRNMRSLSHENTVLKKDGEDFFDMLGMDREQARAYIGLARGRQNPDRTKILLEMTGEDMRHNIIANVREYLLVTETGMIEMERKFPELSAAEREVCLLILQGKKINDICMILGKKASNITSTRTHIRRKLDMKPSDNLLKVLRERVGADRQ